jgi:hypothetical protein
MESIHNPKAEKARENTLSDQFEAKWAKNILPWDLGKKGLVLHLFIIQTLLEMRLLFILI